MTVAARAIWTGSVGFGLVNVPVGLYSATHDETVHFNQFERGTSDRIRYRKVNEHTGEEVSSDDIVEGYDEGGGEYVIVTPDELDEVAPGRSRTIDITDFVDAAQIDPVTYRRTYYLAPQGDAAARPYGLLVRAMTDANRVGIATFVMRGRQYLAAIRPYGDALALETMYFADEVRDPGTELDLPSGHDFAEREIAMATSLIESMTVEWDHDRYHDTYRERVLELIEAKRRGEEIVTEGDTGTGAEITDLMEALQRSLEGAKGRAPAGEDLRGLTKAELYQRAGALDVPGRSKMSRDELEAAVRARTGGRRKAS